MDTVRAPPATFPAARSFFSPALRDFFFGRPLLLAEPTQNLS
jgi:hypothetical protein